MIGIRWMMQAPGQPFAAAEFEPAAGPGEVVVAVAGCGVCHTDLGYLYDGVRTNHPLELTLEIGRASCRERV
jgi:6-hydroxycyclohex-1-ene-1-carbonyl-CoA dehydrogenase